MATYSRSDVPKDAVPVCRGTNCRATREDNVHSPECIAELEASLNPVTDAMIEAVFERHGIALPRVSPKRPEDQTLVDNLNAALRIVYLETSSRSGRALPTCRGWNDRADHPLPVPVRHLARGDRGAPFPIREKRMMILTGTPLWDLPSGFDGRTRMALGPDNRIFIVHPEHAPRVYDEDAQQWVPLKPMERVRHDLD